MNRKDISVLCAISMLILVISASPSMAQVFTIIFPSGASFRFNFMAPSEVEAGKIFEVIAFAEHVSGSPVGIPLLRVTSQPSPVVVPIPPTSGETPLYCDPNWCAYPWMTGMDQESKKMKFMVDPNAPPGQILILKVDVSDNGRQPWQNVEDIRVTVKGVIPPCTLPCTRWDPTTQTCTPITCTTGQHCDPVSNMCVIDTPPPDFVMTVQDPQPQQVTAGQSATATIVINVDHWKGDTIVFTVSAPGLVVTLNPSALTTSGTCSLGIQVPSDAIDGVVPIRVVATGAGVARDWSGQLVVKTDWTPWIIMGVIIALVAIGIIAVFMLTRRRPPRAAAAYKPYPAAPTGPQAVTLKPGAPQAVKPVTHVPRVVARREEKE